MLAGLRFLSLSLTLFMAAELDYSWRSVDESNTTIHFVKRAAIVTTFFVSTAILWIYLKKKRSDLPQNQKVLITLGGLGYALQVAVKLLYIQTNRPCSNEETIGAIILFPFVYLLPVYLAKPATNKYSAKSVRLIYIIGSLLFCLGIYIKTMAEFERKMFKDNPMKKGKLYTQGWNAVTRNPNYFGEILVLTGWNMFINP